MNLQQKEQFYVVFMVQTYKLQITVEKHTLSKTDLQVRLIALDLFIF